MIRAAAGKGTGATPHQPRRRPHLPTLRHRLSEERLRPYDPASGGDATDSLRLYEWNIAVSAALFESLHVLEVVLRNAFHEQLAQLHAGRGHPGQWYERPHTFLAARAGEEVAKARHRLRVSGRPQSAGRVVSTGTDGPVRAVRSRWP